MQVQYDKYFDERGQITVFLSLLFLVLMMSFLFIVEGVISYSASSLGEDAVKGAGESIMANYDRELFKNYHLFFLDPRQKDYIVTDGKEFINQYFSGNSFFDIYCDSLEVTGEKTAVDEDGLYEDTDAVQFMYRFYNKVRKLGFSKELLETYIQTKRQKEYYDIEEVDKTSAKVRDSSKTKQDRRSNNESISYEEFFEEELELEKQKIESPNNRKQKTGDFQIGIKNGRRNSRREVQRNERNRDEKNKNQSNRNQKNKDLNNRSKSQSNENNYLIVCNGLKIISVICTFLAVILEGIFVFYGMRSGFTRQLFQYSVGGMLLIIVFACGFIWSAQTVRKIKQKNKSNSMNSIKDNINKQNKVRHRKRGEQGSPISDKFIQEKELQDRPQMIKTEVDWEAEGDWESGTEGTTILNYGNESEKEDGKICHPMLRDMELGIIYVIKNCPFYIGSAEGVNHLHIQDKTVSREHAVILEDIYEGDGQGYILRDMGSTNGTWLNGKKIKRGNQEQLEDGAVIRFAKKEYEFLIQDI